MWIASSVTRHTDDDERLRDAIREWTKIVSTFGEWVRAVAHVLRFHDLSTLVVPDDCTPPVTLLFRDGRLGTVPSINTTTARHILASAQCGNTGLAFQITLWVCAFLAAHHRPEPASAIGKPTTPPLGLVGLDAFSYDSDYHSSRSSNSICSSEDAAEIAEFLTEEYTAERTTSDSVLAAILAGSTDETVVSPKQLESCILLARARNPTSELELINTAAQIYFETKDATERQMPAYDHMSVTAAKDLAEMDDLDPRSAAANPAAKCTFCDRPATTVACSHCGCRAHNMCLIARAQSRAAQLLSAEEWVNCPQCTQGSFEACHVQLFQRELARATERESTRVACEALARHDLATLTLTSPRTRADEPDEAEQAALREHWNNILSPASAASTLEATLGFQRDKIERLLVPHTPCSEIFSPLIALAMAFKSPSHRSSVIFASPPRSTYQAYSRAIEGWTLIFSPYKSWVRSVAEYIPRSVAEFEALYDHHNDVPLLLGDESLGSVRHIAAHHQERIIELARLDGTIAFAMAEFLSGFWARSFLGAASLRRVAPHRVTPRSLTTCSYRDQSRGSRPRGGREPLSRIATGIFAHRR